MHNGHYLIIPTASDFSFKECLVYLNRSPQEVLHKAEGESIIKLLMVNKSLVLLKMRSTEKSLIVEFPFGKPGERECDLIPVYISEWFDLKRDMADFYKMAQGDSILKNLVSNHPGLRIVGIQDLFEALTWAVIGQQINLTFAYTLKRRFVENFGERLEYQGEDYWLYPHSEKIASLQVSDLRKLQFTTRKAEYVIGIAKAIVSREITKEELLQLDYHKMKSRLMKLRGVGVWTAEYVMLRCLLQPQAFPAADIGIHHALRKQLGLDRKPTTNYVEELSERWGDWRAYAAFHLWRSQY
ncbi:DNA-3-methyladenine glycosylase family protein [Halobacillus naozhouensis]|uniref:DNA-3-methyladenine glycosylase II n=1 Tax=Halobacillus naozhouensis TaxID=554880 RepID=A0ABY8J1A8_9BACI|nr:DNA-3-methyladenine glycosylase 2 [Halobacillus naozhouensis]WFT74676.1 DNA-3-methyladenine glycosylase 2 [Halobacillus naozhouensis]